MCEPVHVEVPCSCDAAGLVEAFAARGLNASLTTLHDHYELEVGYGVESDVRLHRDIGNALEAWLEKGDHALVPLEHEHGFVLQPPAD